MAAWKWSPRLFGQLAASFAFRFACYAVMVWLALWAEARPAPSLPDAVLAVVPFVGWVDRFNYLLWLGAYLPIAVVLLLTDAPRFCRYMYSSGFVALLRGLCIAATGLGPVNGQDVNAGIDAGRRAEAFFSLASPFSFFGTDSPRLYLTKDLFFSGHTATTFLLLLYVWKDPRLRWPMLAAHVAVVASVFFAHLHYTIDVVGAYALTFCVFFLREGSLATLLGGEQAASGTRQQP